MSNDLVKAFFEEIHEGLGACFYAKTAPRDEMPDLVNNMKDCLADAEITLELLKKETKVPPPLEMVEYIELLRREIGKHDNFI